MYWMNEAIQIFGTDEYDIRYELDYWGINPLNREEVLEVACRVYPHLPLTDAIQYAAQEVR